MSVTLYVVFLARVIDTILLFQRIPGIIKRHVASRLLILFCILYFVPDSIMQLSFTDTISCCTSASSVRGEQKEEVKQPPAQRPLRASVSIRRGFADHRKEVSKQ